MNSHDFSGLGVALATPFAPDGALDLPAYRRLVRHVAAHADVLVVLGTTGEAPTVLEAEREALIAATLEEAGGKKVVAGTGSSPPPSPPPSPGRPRPRAWTAPWW